MNNNNEELQFTGVGVVAGLWIGLAYAFETGALQAFWAASGFLTQTPLRDVSRVAMPMIKGAVVGGALAYTGYTLYGLYANHPVQNPPLNYQNFQHQLKR
jgi:hypothetical protein